MSGDDTRVSDLAALLSGARTQSAASSGRLLVPDGDGVIFFGGGLPDPALWPTEAIATRLVELLHQPDADLLGYSHGAGDLQLRDAIARHFSTRERTSVAAEQIVVTNGSSGALALLAVALIEPGDVVVAEALTYPGALATFRQMGADVAPVPVGTEGIDCDALESELARLQHAGARVKMIYTIATCQSPTGSVLAATNRWRLAEIADRYDVLIVQDATYADIRFTDDFPSELITIAPQRTVHVGSFSKTLAPGLRLGWAAGPPAIVDVLARIRTDLGTSRLVQRTVARLITGGEFDAQLQRARSWYRDKRDVLLDALTLHCGELASWAVPRGGFFVWLQWTSAEPSRVRDECARQRVGAFGAPYFSVAGAAPPGLRLAYGELANHELVEGARRLGSAIRAAS